MVGETGKKVILRSNDNKEFSVDESLAKESQMLTFLMDDLSTDRPVSLPNVNAACLAKIISYWQVHKSAMSADEIKVWDKEFVAVMDRAELFDMISSANYLNTKELFDLLSATIADAIKNMSVEQVRDYFGIENDFTAEEEAAIRKENEWAFD